jgi:(p)ppGpp synthase/HD superfamily hydrolase
MSTLAEAILLAVQAHHGQTQRNGQPYILHPLSMMLRFDADEDAQIVAVLHDVVEDTAVSLDDLRAIGFAPQIVEAVDHLTRREGESYEAFIERIRPHPLACKVKLADLRDNLNALRLVEYTESDMERFRRYRAAWDVLTAEGDG